MWDLCQDGLYLLIHAEVNSCCGNGGRGGRSHEFFQKRTRREIFVEGNWRGFRWRRGGCENVDGGRGCGNIFGADRRGCGNFFGAEIGGARNLDGCGEDMVRINASTQAIPYSFLLGAVGVVLLPVVPFHFAV
jgi:hypothetical protein